MPLDRFLTGHFAPHHSPTRERREAGFAVPMGSNPNPDKGKTPTPEEGKTTEITAQTAATRIEGIMAGSALAKDVAGIDRPSIDSQEVAEHLIYLHRIPQKRLQQVGESILISENDFAFIRQSISDPHLDELAAIVATHDLSLQALFIRVNTADMYLFDWVCAHCPPTLKQSFIDQLSPDIEGQLEANPEVTLQSARDIRRTIEKFETLKSQLEGFMQIDDRFKKIIELQNDLHETQDKRVDESTRRAIEQEIEREEKMMQQSILRPDGTLGSKLQTAFENHFKNVEGEQGRRLSRKEKDNICIDAILEIKRNADKKLREKKNFGGKSASQLSQQYEKSETYLERLTRQEHGLRIILNAQLQQRARFIYRLHADRLNQMIRKLNIENVHDITDVQEILRNGGENVFGKKPTETTNPEKREAQSRAKSLDSAFLRTYGVSVVVFLVEFDQLRKHVLRQYRQNTKGENDAFRLAFPELAYPQGIEPETNYDMPPGPNDPSDPKAKLNFLENADCDIVKWDKREQELLRKPDDPRSLEPDLVRLQQEQLDIETWAFTMADEIRKIEEELPEGKAWSERIDMARSLLGIPEQEKYKFLTDLNNYLEVIRNYQGCTTPEARVQLRAQLDKCVTPATFPPEIQRNITRCLALLSHPEYFEKTVEESKATEARMQAETRNTSIETVLAGVCKDTRKRLDETIGALIPIRSNRDTSDATIRRDLHPALRHRITTYLNIEGMLTGMHRALTDQMDAAEKDGDRHRGLRAMYNAQSEVDKLKTCIEYLEEMNHPNARTPILVDTLPDDVFAWYDRGTGKVKINRKHKDHSSLGKALEHERGHAVLHILTERSGLLPNLITLTFEQFRQQKSGTKTFEELLFGLKNVGSYKHIEKQNLPAEVKKKAYTEELLVRYADWKARWQRNFDPNEETLFTMLEKGAPARASTNLNEKHNELRGQLESIGPPKDWKPFTTVDEDTEDQKPKKEVFSMKESLGESSRMLGNIKQFIGAYKNDDQMPRDIFRTFQELYTDGNNEHTELSQKFINQKKWDGGVAPEDNEADRKRCENLQRYLGKLEGVVRKYDGDRLDTTKESRYVSAWESLTGGIRLASINDIVRLWNDTMEDIKDMYKRRQDALLKDVGYALSKPLQDSTLLKKIPGLGNYVPGLHAYHQRRYSGTEQEAASKWQEGMKNEDSHTLLHFLHYTTNKDAIRGIISLLCDRGEMDWNDDGVWKTLNSISGYSMPIGACKRSDVLRDTWLRKIVSYIWNDKELYYHWRAENDSKTKSGMDHFNAWVDQLSNVGGGMKSELNKQLRLMEEWNAHKHGTPPEDIKPHLYEKVIHYAIDMGKMSMEDKFYYLIRGVSSGILSIDRLRTMAGAEGGVLNQFPFIDYFYGRNNTLPEVKELARRLTEKGDDGKDTFKPGAKTTMWIQLELVRDTHVQARVSKATSGTRAESIDHEDVPLLLPQLNFIAVRNMADVVSGSRQKMSPEALKNLYCGYSGKFKVFGRLAQLEDEKHMERFSFEDADNLAEAITAYIDYDNIVTQKARDKDSYAILSASQLRGQPPSAEGSYTTMNYRKNLNNFVAKLVGSLRGKIEGTEHWKNFQKTIKKDKKTGTGQYELDEWANLDTTRSEDLLYNGKETSFDLSQATKYFLEGLKEVLRDRSNLQVLKNTLKEFTKDYVNGQSPPDSFLDEFGSAGQLSLDNAVRSVEDRNAARASLAQVNGVAHH